MPGATQRESSNTLIAKDWIPGLGNCSMHCSTTYIPVGVRYAPPGMTISPEAPLKLNCFKVLEHLIHSGSIH
jgi:hypothetical protein